VGPAPYLLAINPVTNKIYVPNYDSGTVTVIDGTTNGTTPVTVGVNPYSVVVNPVTNKIYVGNYGSTYVTVIDGVTNDTTNVTVPEYSSILDVNPVTNKIYVPCNYANDVVTVIDGATNGTTTVTVGSYPISVAVNPATNKVYVANQYANNITVINVDQSQAVPNTVTASGVADSQTLENSNLFATTNSNPSFTGTATSAYSASSAYSGLSSLTNPTLTSLYYWVDDGTSTGWTWVSPSSGSFSVTLSDEIVGVHTLYLFAGYGDEGVPASSGNGTGNSPEISNLVAVPFVVLPIPTATVVVADANPQSLNSGVTFTATVTPNVAGAFSPSGTVSFFDGSTLLGSGSLVDNVATFATSSLTAGSHTITAIYSGDTHYASSTTASLTEQILLTPSVSAWPTASAITYGQTLAASTLTGGSSTPGGTFAWTTPTTMPTAGTASYSVTFTPTDSTDYSTVTSTVSVTANQVAYTVTFVTDGTPGATLTGSTSQSITSGGSTTAVTAVAPSGYTFLNWTGVNGFVGGFANPLTVTNVTGAYVITANFAAPRIAVERPGKHHPLERHHRDARPGEGLQHRGQEPCKHQGLHPGLAAAVSKRLKRCRWNPNFRHPPEGCAAEHRRAVPVHQAQV